MVRVLRFKDLKSRGIIQSRMTLARWIASAGFPRPIRLGENSRAWDEVEIDAWLDSRRTAFPAHEEPSSERRPRGRPKCQQAASASDMGRLLRAPKTRLNELVGIDAEVQPAAPNVGMDQSSKDRES